MCARGDHVRLRRAVLLAGDQRPTRAAAQARADRRGHRESGSRSEAEDHFGAHRDDAPLRRRRASPAGATTAIRPTSRSIGPTSSGTSWRRRSSPSTRSAGVSRSRVAWRIAAISTKRPPTASRRSSLRMGSIFRAEDRRLTPRSGYFDDPVLSTMVNGGEQYVASLLFHELAHQQLYVKSDSEFSEAFAMVVEELGTERWLAQHGTPADLERYRTRRQRRRAVRRAHRGAASSIARAVCERRSRPSNCVTTRSAPSTRCGASTKRSRRLARQHGLRRVVRSAAQQRNARVGRDLHALVARVALAARGSGTPCVLRRCGGASRSSTRRSARNGCALGRRRPRACCRERDASASG